MTPVLSRRITNKQRLELSVPGNRGSRSVKFRIEQETVHSHFLRYSVRDLRRRRSPTALRRRTSLNHSFGLQFSRATIEIDEEVATGQRGQARRMWGRTEGLVRCGGALHCNGDEMVWQGGTRETITRGLPPWQATNWGRAAHEPVRGRLTIQSVRLQTTFAPMDFLTSVGERIEPMCSAHKAQQKRHRRRREGERRAGDRERRARHFPTFQIRPAI